MIKFIKKHNKLTTARVAFLGTYLAIMIVFKYTLGFIPGVEVITFMFMIAGIFFPLRDGFTLVISFNLSIVAMYGWGTWQIMYWIIWPVDIVASKLLTKFTNNIFSFAFLGFCLGFSIAFWYFLSDLFFYGLSYALLNIISAVPINTIEGFTTSFVILSIGPSISLLFKDSSHRLWNIKNPFKFRKPKKKKLALIIVVMLNTFFLVGIILLFLYNQSFLDLKQTLSGISKPATKIEY